MRIVRRAVRRNGKRSHTFYVDGNGDHLMRRIFLLAGAVLIAQSVPVVAQGQGQGRGEGQGNQGRGEASQARRDADTNENRGNDRADRRERQAAPDNAARIARPAAERQEDGRSDRAQPDRQRQQDQRVTAQRETQGDARRSAQVRERGDRSDARRTIANGRYSWRPPEFKGCPPGLEKKNNGCLPPGQARRLANANDRDLRWYRYSDWYRARSGDDWRYDNGYAYLVDPTTNFITSRLPLLGGALFSGANWPTDYTNYRVTPYQVKYYGSDQRYDYRYADGAIFAVDPQTQVVQSIVSLVTGDDWAVGARMPAGSDVYNVPMAYRDRYADNSSSLYRYNDGYVYEVDPTTQVIRSLIELVV